MELTRGLRITCWIFQILVAAILLQTLFFKFSGATESVYIFTMLGAEPWGRIGSGVVELIASILLLIPATAILGAIISLATMAVAILSHLTVLGLALHPVGDNGELFTLAVIVFLASAAVIFIRRSQIPLIGA